MIFLHNITKNWYNETELIEAVENSEKGDLIKYTISGDAQIYDLKTLISINKNDIKHLFIEKFKEINNENFYDI